MLKRFQDIFSKSPTKNGIVISKDPEAVEERLRIATAVILLEVAYADEDFSDAERDGIVGLLKREFKLDEEGALELLEMSEEKRQNSLDLWHFTRVVNENCSEEEKIKIIESVWRLAYTDGVLDKYEDCIVHKLSNLLRLSHQQMIAAKLKIIHGDQKK